MRHFWFTDDEGNNVTYDHVGNIRGARRKAEEYLKEHLDIDTIYINEGDNIVDCIFRA